MHPVLFEISGREFSSFTILQALALVAAGVVVAIEMRRRGWDPGESIEAVTVTGIAGVVGARFYHALFAWDRFAVDPLGFMISDDAGMTFYGGLAASLLAIAIWLRCRRRSLAVGADIAGVAIPIAYAIGRVGCLLVGDDYGVPTNLPWAMTFPEGAPPTTTPVHPTQVYEILAGLAIFAVVWRLRRWDRAPGALFGVSMALLGLERFLVEFVRRNPEIALGLTIAQWISLALVAGGTALLLARPGSSAGREVPAR